MRSVSFAAALIAGLIASGGTARASCYEFALAQSPERTPEAGKGSAPVTYCYESWSENGLDRTLVYALGHEPRPELTALVARSANGDVQSLVHGSRAQGQIKIHATAQLLVNPLPVPLEEQEAALLGTLKHSFISNGFRKKLKKLEQEFRTHHPTETIYKVAPGEFIENLDEDVLPYGGFWWPYSTLELASGPYSPMGKYDAYMAAKTGTDPKSREWEIEHHSYDAVEWGGHCNGWVASSILHDELEAPVWEPLTETVIHNNDINGLFAASSFCVDWAFYGVRNYGNGDLQDISPVKFHKVLIYYIKHLQKPVAMDYYRTDAVDNNIIGGYTFNINPVENVDNQYQVTAILHARDYDKWRNDEVGGALERTFVYSYVLEVDDDDEITGGHWTGGDNPDFMWVPLAQRNCGRENPRVEPVEVEKLRTELEPAAWRTDTVDWQVDFPFLAGEEFTLVPATSGSRFAVSLGEVQAPAGLQVVVRAHAAHPKKWSVGVQEYVFTANQFSNGSLPLFVERLESITVRNVGTEDILEGTFSINDIQYWGAPLESVEQP